MAERQVGERLSDQAVFVDGIGPPLSQIREDNVPLLPDSQQARDIVNLIDAYLSQARQLAEADPRSARSVLTAPTSGRG